MIPPKAKKEPKQLVAHGDTRIDNYYWMRLTDEQKKAEKLDAQTQEVVDYLNAENAYMEHQLNGAKELKETLYNEIVARLPQKEVSVPYLSNKYWYYTRYEEGMEYPIYCRKKGDLEQPEEVILDVNQLAEGKPYCQLGTMSISMDNKWLAYSMDFESRRIYTIYFKNLETGETLKETISGISGGVAWAADNQTIFYTSIHPETLLSEKVWRHKLHTEQSSDVLVYTEKDPSYYIGVYKTKSDRYIVIWNKSTLSSDYWILDAANPEGTFRQLTERLPDHEYHIAHFEDKFYIISNWEAVNFRLFEAPVDSKARSEWVELLPHRTDTLLENIEIFKDFLVIEERRDGLVHLRILNQKTQEVHYMEFEEAVYLAYIGTNHEFDTPILRFGYTSMATPPSVYDYNMETRTRELKKQKEVVGGHNPADYKVERLRVTARDGEEVFVSLVHHKDWVKSSDSPVLLYGYGAYGYTIDPGFSYARLSLLQRGFAFAIAHIRGGQMKGREWYENGRTLNKKNTFSDFIDCGQYLVDNGYTSPEKLYGMGGSAGGLLIGAVANMAPDLFHGLVAGVPFVDVLTTMSDPTIPLTTNEYDEWGNPENKEYYDYIKSYSPYDNIESKSYSNILITTGYFDSQVQYWEPAKWIAKLREYKTGDNLLLMYTDMEAGHSGASGRFKQYKLLALEYSFFVHLAGVAANV